MTALRRLVLLCNLMLLGACTTTNDEPFSLDDGDNVSPHVGGYLCTLYDERGKGGESREVTLVLLQRNLKSQYVEVDKNTSANSPFTIHRVKEGVYIISSARSGAAGETLFAAQFSTQRFTLFNYFKDTKGRAQRLASKYGVTFNWNKILDWSLIGPLESQKAFMLDLASDLKDWQMGADCAANP